MKGDLLLSFTAAGTIGGLSVDDSDIVRFTGTLGNNTSGTFSFYFDGSDVGLSGSSRRDVDAAGFTSAGTLALSIVADSTVGGFATADEDVLDFVGSFGTTTSGSFFLRLDLSSLGIGSSEDVGSLHVVD